MNIVSPPLKIVCYPHPALRHPATPLTCVDGNLRRIAEAMLDLMYAHKGLGLAAPQVSLPFQMFVANFAGDPEQRDLEGVFINPVVRERRGGMDGEEGCLSFPGLYRKVHRSRHVSVAAYNLQGQLVEMELSELSARVWQHESDHLEGKLFIDKVSVVGKMTLGGPLAEFERDYKKAQQRGEIPPDASIQQYLAQLEQTGPPDITPPAQAL
jgi:peptide deformylase